MALDPGQSAADTAAASNNRLTNVAEAEAVLQAPPGVGQTVAPTQNPAPIQPAPAQPAPAPQADSGIQAETIYTTPDGRKFRIRPVAKDREAEAMEYLAQQQQRQSQPAQQPTQPGMPPLPQGDAQFVAPDITPRPVGGGLYSLQPQKPPAGTRLPAGAKQVGGRTIIEVDPTKTYIDAATGEVVTYGGGTAGAPTKDQLKAQEAAKKEAGREESQVIKTSTLARELSSAYENLAKIPERGSLGTLWQGAKAKVAPKSEEALFNKAATAIKSIKAFDELQEMRANSPTGGALGNVSDKDIEILQNQIGQIDFAGDRNIVTANMANLLIRSANIIYGTDAQLDAAVASGATTQELADQNRELREQMMRDVVGGSYHKAPQLDPTRARKTK
jgi:hypothetical protein